MYYYFYLQHFKIVNCLHEWRFGHESVVPFTGEQYDSVHRAMMTLIDMLEDHEYHGPKFRRLLRKIASDAQRSVICLFVFALLIFNTRMQNMKRGNPRAHGFKVILD